MVDFASTSNVFAMVGCIVCGYMADFNFNKRWYHATVYFNSRVVQICIQMGTQVESTQFWVAGPGRKRGPLNEDFGWVTVFCMCDMYSRTKVVGGEFVVTREMFPV